MRNVPSPIDILSDQDVQQESFLPLRYSNIGGAFAGSMRLLAPYSATLSDEFQSAKGISADPPTTLIAALDAGQPTTALLEAGGLRPALKSIEYDAGELLKSETKISFTQDSNRRRLLFIGHFFLGSMKHLVAAYFGNAPRSGGSTLVETAFIPSTALHDSALKHYAVALKNTSSPYEGRLVNSFIARIHLLEGRYSQALQAAVIGLHQGDPSFSTIYNTGLYNRWVDFAGLKANHTIIPDPRFRAYVEAEPGEAARIAMAKGTRPTAGRTEPYYIQTKYSDYTPIEVMTWQENALMLAELRLRLTNDVPGALEEVNRVRASVSAVPGAPKLVPRTTTHLDSVYIERDKQFFGTGLRLLDQRRFDRWHFPPADSAKTWHYLPNN